MSVLMSCGHAPNATNEQGLPSCAICVGIHPGAETIMENTPDLSQRMAKCGYCSRKVPSNQQGIAFFGYRPDKAEDTYYCGCMGWD